MAFNDGEFLWSTLTPKLTQLADSPFNASCDTKINENWIQKREVLGFDCVYLKLYFEGLRKRSEKNVFLFFWYNANGTCIETLHGLKQLFYRGNIFSNPA